MIDIDIPVVYRVREDGDILCFRCAIKKAEQGRLITATASNGYINGAQCSECMEIMT